MEICVLDELTIGLIAQYRHNSDAIKMRFDFLYVTHFNHRPGPPSSGISIGFISRMQTLRRKTQVVTTDLSSLNDANERIVIHCTYMYVHCT